MNYSKENIYLNYQTYVKILMRDGSMKFLKITILSLRKNTKYILRSEQVDIL